MGQVGRRRVRLFRQSQSLEQFGHLGVGGRRHPRTQQLIPSEVTNLAQKEILSGGQVGKESRRLEFAGDTESSAAIWRQPGNLLTEDVDVARRRGLDVGYEVEKGALAGAV